MACTFHLRPTEAWICEGARPTACISMFACSSFPGLQCKVTARKSYFQIFAKDLRFNNNYK